jgi:hypothetical protein
VSTSRTELASPPEPGSSGRGLVQDQACGSVSSRKGEGAGGPDPCRAGWARPVSIVPWRSATACGPDPGRAREVAHPPQIAIARLGTDRFLPAARTLTGSPGRPESGSRPVQKETWWFARTVAGRPRACRDEVLEVAASNRVRNLCIFDAVACGGDKVRRATWRAHDPCEDDPCIGSHRRARGTANRLFPETPSAFMSVLRSSSVSPVASAHTPYAELQTCGDLTTLSSHPG